MDATAVVETRGLSKRYGGKAVVAGIDLRVERNECFGVLGPNGAGKTTTLRMLLGMTPPDGGELRVLGHPVPAQASAMRRRLGVVPQTDSLDPDFSVTENLLTYGSYFGLGRAELARRLPDLLAFASLQHKADARIDELSGGMKRRLAIARALINDPELVILDEPTTGLDPQARQLIWQRLRSLLHQGRTLILITHYMEEAQRLCSRVAIMDQGILLDCDSPARLIERHIEPHVVEIYGVGTEAWFAGSAGGRFDRAERVGETLFCYVRDERPLLDALYGQTGLHYLHRPANLEDVFLKLTGRDLRD